MRIYPVHVICHEWNVVGERPLWNEAEQTFYGCDIHASAMPRLGFDVHFTNRADQEAWGG
jgi:hypothetical protein